jgi:hypothetical protein
MMKFPDKDTAYSKSVISLFPYILEQLSKTDMKPLELFNALAEHKPQKENTKASVLCSYWNVLDCLFYLGRITFDEERSVLCYVEDDKMR